MIFANGSLKTIQILFVHQEWLRLGKYVRKSWKRGWNDGTKDISGIKESKKDLYLFNYDMELYLDADNIIFDNDGQFNRSNRFETWNLCINYWFGTTYWFLES
jgi:hypothetical protein